MRLNVSYPGDYTPPAPPVLHGDGFLNVIPATPFIWGYVIIGVVTVIAAIVLHTVWSDYTDGLWREGFDYESDRRAVTLQASWITAVAVAALTAVLGFVAVGITGQERFDSNTAATTKYQGHTLPASRASYIAAVKGWLTDDYGIAASDDAAWDLTQGKQRVADTVLGSKLIELRPTMTDSKAVYIVGGDVLPMKASR